MGSTQSRPGSRRRFAVPACLLALTLLGLRGGAAGPPALADPVPLRRILLPPARVPAEVERARQGVLVKMPRDEFEARVQGAARAGARAANPPRLARAAYTARLDSDALVGSGDWTVVNPGDAPGILGLADFNLALRKVTLDDDAASAVLGDLDGKVLGLLAARSGKQSVFFDWSLRGGPAAGELHFDLQVPACPIASLELTLPADRTVSVARGAALLSGPHEAPRAEDRTWRIQFAGRSRLDLTVRRLDGPGRVPPIVLAQLQATQQLTPQCVLARYEFQVEVLHNALDRFVFDYDPALQPYDVTVARGDLKGWEFGTAQGGGKGGPPLTVRLREPFQGSLQPLRITVLCLAPLFKNKNDRSWVSPGMRLRDAASQVETLKLVAQPDVRLENFRPATFRLTQTGSASDGAQVLTLKAGPSPGPAARPAASVRTHGVDFLARQKTWWQVGPNGSSLTAEVTYEVTRGSLFKLPLRVPGNWQLDEVRMEPKDLLGNLVSAGGKTALLVIAEPQRALTPGTSVRLTVRLHSPLGKGAPPAGVTLPFPDVEPVGAPLREGALAISVDPSYRARVLQASHPASAAEGAGPWGKAVPDEFYVHKEKPVTGKLRLEPHRPRFNARCTGEARLAAGGASLSVRLQLDPVAGSPAAVDLQLSAATAGRWSWSSEGQPGLVRGLRRLPGLGAGCCLLALGARNPLEAAAAAATVAAQPAGERWRLTLARPLTRRETVTLETPLPALAEPPAGEAQRWDVPLLTVPGAERMEGEMTLHLVGTQLLEVKAAAAREARREGPAPRTGPARQDVWRTFRYGPALFPGQLPALGVRGRTLTRDGSSHEVCDRSRLTTYVEPGGRLLHHFRFRVWNWRQGGLQLLLPAGTELLAAKVEGRWVDRLERREAGPALKVELPVPRGANPLHFEVVYTSAGAGPWWSPWARLEAPPPGLPVPPAALERTWRLPPGLLPLSPSARRLPDPLGPRDREPWWSGVRGAWHAGRSWLAALGPEFAPEAWADGQRRALAEAEERVQRGPAGKSWRLGGALERLTADPLRQRGTLVIDATALRAAGVGPAARFTPEAPRSDGQPSLFDPLGLAYLPCKTGALLTTRRQTELWRAAAGESVPPDGAVAQAVAEAVAHGRDSSGRFQAVTYWLHEHDPDADLPGDGAAGGPATLSPDSFGAAWTEWATMPGGAEDVLVVVREGGVRALGFTLAGLFCLLAWRGRRGLSRPWRFRLLLAWLAASGLALIWLPAVLRAAAWWPALAGVAVAALACVRAAWRSRSGGAAHGSGSAVRAAKVGTASALGLAVLALLPPVSSQGPEPYPVLILGGPEDAPARQSVLVAPDLLKKLDEFARRGRPRGAVLLSALYTGQVVGDRADFTAEFQVYCPAAEANLALPLAGVELKEGALWAGARVYPVAAADPQRGYVIPIRKRGPQPVNTLQLSFSVRVPAAGDGRELRFTVPRAPQSRLVLALPKEARAVQAVSAAGAQGVTPQPGGPRLEADLGLAPTLLVRWRSQARPPRPRAPEVRETYLWDLRPPVSTLAAVFQYAVGNVPTSSFAVELPEGLDVRTLDVSQVGTPPEGSPPARLRDWRVTGAAGNRHLRVALQAPAIGEVQLTLDLVTRLAAAPGVLRLRLPRPDGNPVEGALAYIVEGLKSSPRAPALTVFGARTEAFARTWQRLGMGAPAALTWATGFRRQQGTAMLELVLATPGVEGRQEVDWQVTPRFADFKVSAALTAPGDGPTLLEWSVPGNVTVAEVTGPRVHHWTPGDGHVQVWLKPAGMARGPVKVQLRGWVQYPQPGPGRDGRFHLPCVRLVSAQPSVNLVRVSAAPELTLVPDREPSFQQLQRLPEQGTAGALVYRALQPWYRGEFLFRPSPVVPHVRALTVAEVRDGALAFTARLDYQVRHGELRTAAVRLRHWEGEARVEAPRGVQVREQRGPGGERLWHLTLPPGGTRQFSIKVTGALPLKAGASVPMPDVSAPDAASMERWLAVLRRGLRAEAPAGLVPVPARTVTAELGAWPAEAERVGREGTAWRAEADGWSLRLAGRPAEAAPAVQVLYAEQEAAVADLRRWVHQATYWLHAGSGTDLPFKLPQGARLLAANLDGAAIDPRQPEADWLELFLPGGEGLRVLRLRWVFEAAEPLGRPKLEEPTFVGVDGGPVLWRIDVPGGYGLHRLRVPAEAARPANVAVAELARAAAQVRLSTLLAERFRAAPADDTWGQFLVAQKLFFRHAHRAADLLAAPTGPGGVTGPQGQGLTDWLAELRRQNARLAPAPEFSKVRAAAEKQGAAAEPDAVPPFFALPERGVPVYWYASGPEQPPPVALTAHADERWREAWSATELLVIALLVVCVLSYLPRVQVWLWRLLPEELVLLTWLGWQAFGLSPLGVLLFATGVSARVVLLLAWLSRVFRPAPRPEATGSSFPPA